MPKRKLRMGMVGGGRDAFIGAVHRMAAAIDGQIELVCGAFSSSAEKSRVSGRDLYLPDERIYDSYEAMFAAEKNLSESERMDFVSIVTPNFLHAPVATAALDAGFHVVCDKPMTLTLEEAKALRQKVTDTGLLFCLTHNYTGYPLVKEARAMIREGELGQVRKVVVEYPQGWLATPLDQEGNKQASWRTDPQRAGSCGCMGDIGTHAENLAEYMTGLQISELCADLTTFVPGRELDDDGNVLVRFDNGARGILYASQISVGEENGLRIRIYGEKGGLEWVQVEPNTLIAKWLDRPTQLIRTGVCNRSSAAQANVRVPPGHPEGFIEAFGNIYRAFAEALQHRLDGETVSVTDCDFPTVEDGVRGMAFLDTLVRSQQSQSKWEAMVE